jgi:hypothetical protein
MSGIRVGSLVVFREPNPDELDKDGKQVPMKVIELNGDRALVEALVALPVRPQSVHPVADLVLADFQTLMS